MKSLLAQQPMEFRIRIQIWIWIRIYEALLDADPDPIAKKFTKMTTYKSYPELLTVNLNLIFLDWKYRNLEKWNAEILKLIT